jgi:hypothetical protein
MADRRLCSLALVCVGNLLVGCHVSGVRVTPPPAAGCAENQVAPQAIEPNVQPLAESQVDPAVVPATASEDLFAQLFEVDCQCQAAQMAPTADLLELEGRLASGLADCQHGDAACALQLQTNLLQLQVVEHRNAAAAEALRNYYRLADVEGRVGKLQESVRVLDEAIARAERLHERGLLQGVDRSALRRQRLELVAKRKALELARTQLNAALRTQLGCDPTTSPNYWPEISWAVKPLPIDEPVALGIALAQRPDVRSLHTVLAGLNQATLPVARAALSAADPALGTAESVNNWLGELHCPDGTCDEVAVRQTQLMRLLSTTQLNIAAEVRAAVALIEAATGEVLLAEKTVLSWRDRVNELRRTRDVAGSTVFEVSAAEAELLSAEATLIEKITALRLARLKLREVQAILPAECGLDALAPSHMTFEKVN